MSNDARTGAAPPRSPGAGTWWERWRGEILASAALVAGLVAGLSWSSEPNRRRRVLFEAPVRIEAGARVVGRFTPEHRGDHVIDLRFPRAWFRPLSEPGSDDHGELDALAKAVGGGWRGRPTAPPGFRASFTVRDGSRILHEGTTGEHFTAWFGGDAVGLYLTRIPEAPLVPLDLEVRIDSAVADLARHEAYVRAGPGGDWIHYAWLDGAFRTLLVGGAFVLLASLLLYGSLTRGRRRRLQLAERGRSGG